MAGPVVAVTTTPPPPKVGSKQPAHVWAKAFAATENNAVAAIASFSAAGEFVNSVKAFDVATAIFHGKQRDVFIRDSPSSESGRTNPSD
jgi:hypothetical protein